MKRYIFILLAIVAMLSACDNQNSVNILIANTAQQTIINRQVTIQLNTIRQWLNTTVDDTLILLNEKNQPLPYTYNKDRTAITFCVPIIQQNSQKNFSINKSDIHLSQNILAFRRKNIEVSLE